MFARARVHTHMHIQKFKTTELRLKIDLVSHNAHVGGLG